MHESKLQASWSVCVLGWHAANPPTTILATGHGNWLLGVGEAVTTRSENRALIQPVLQHIQELSEPFESFEISLVWRTSNLTAHITAKQGCMSSPDYALPFESVEISFVIFFLVRLSIFLVTSDYPDCMRAESPVQRGLVRTVFNVG
jgi:hypothetical protein